MQNKFYICKRNLGDQSFFFFPSLQARLKFNLRYSSTAGFFTLTNVTFFSYFISFSKASYQYVIHKKKY